MAGTVFWYPLHRRFTWMSQNNVASQHQTKLAGKIPNLLCFFFLFKRSNTPVLYTLKWTFIHSYDGIKDLEFERNYSWFILWKVEILCSTNRVLFNQFYTLKFKQSEISYYSYVIKQFVKWKLVGGTHNLSWPKREIVNISIKAFAIFSSYR